MEQQSVAGILGRRWRRKSEGRSGGGEEEKQEEQKLVYHRVERGREFSVWERKGQRRRSYERHYYHTKQSTDSKEEQGGEAEVSSAGQSPGGDCLEKERKGREVRERKREGTSSTSGRRCGVCVQKSDICLTPHPPLLANVRFKIKNLHKCCPGCKAEKLLS